MALPTSWTAVLVVSVIVGLEESWKTSQASLALVTMAFPAPRWGRGGVSVWEEIEEMVLTEGSFPRMCL